ncbi:MAG: amidohydrolase family protein [Spirochaetaceae bacterium]|nr:amidohydrolase family protein [Spirochaetaceae bacterium]
MPESKDGKHESAAGGRIVFRNANLLDGDHAARPGTTVCVRGERIESVEHDAAYQAKPGDEVYDLDGRTLMPGMVQTHFHSHFGAFGDGVRAPSLGLEAAPPYVSMLAAYNAGLCLDAGFTGAIGSSNAFTIDVSLKEAIQAGFVRGPRYLAGSHELVTTGEYSDYDNNRNYYMKLGDTGLTRKCDGPDEWALAGRTEAGRGCDVIKISAGPGHGSSPAREILYQTRAELHALVEAVHKLGKMVRAHAPSKISILECARAGVDIIDHADRIDDECVEAILENDCTVVPSMLWSERFLALAEPWDHDATPLPISEGFPETPDVARARIRAVRADYDYTCKAMPEAARAGVRMVVGDDYGTPIMPHGDYVPELELYVKTLGMPPLDVIRWATKNGAEAMRLGDQTGTIEAGKLADLVIVDGDPLVDIACLGIKENLRAILLGGRFTKNTLGLSPGRGASA